MGLAQYLRVLGNCWVVPAGPRLVFVVLVVLLIVVLVIVGVVTRAQTSQSYTQVIMNLLNGQQYFGAPHVYQGDYYGKPTSRWPVYYGPNNASQYWSRGHIVSNQPVLELVPAPSSLLPLTVSGAMFWQEEYYNGSLVRITIIVTYSNWSIPFTSIIYLFLKPTMWGISPRYNYSIPYTSSWRGWDSCYGPPFLKGDTILPQSSTPYIVVWWVPLLQVGISLYGTTGQWDVMIASNTNSSNPCSYLSYTGIGTGYFKPKPGDWIKITVTYDPSTNILSGVAYDMNHTGWKASFTLYLDGYYKPPSSGTYVFGVGANGPAANVALLYMAMTMKPAPPPSLAPGIVVVVLIVVAVVLIIAAAILITVLRMIKRSER